jgi:ribosomal protein S18 acetylase RimI-like enzyme
MIQPVDPAVISEDGADAIPDIEGALLRSLHESSPQAENASFVLTARDSEGDLVGGLVANTSYGWLLIKSLWVATAYRRQSFGRSLMDHAEERARSIGCHAAWLDTSNPDAMRFYAKLGYTTFGELANSPDQCPPGHQRWFMKKAL